MVLLRAPLALQFHSKYDAKQVDADRPFEGFVPGLRNPAKIACSSRFGSSFF